MFKLNGFFVSCAILFSSLVQGVDTKPPVSANAGKGRGGVFSFLFGKNGKEDIVFPHNTEGEKERYAILSMGIFQVFRKHQNIYWAFESAGHGPEGWKIFQDSERNGRLTRDAFRILGNIGVARSFIGTQLPDLTEMETLQHRQKTKDFLKFKPHLPHLKSRAKNIATLLLICGDGTFNCPQFQTNVGFLDSQSLSHALEYAQKESDTWPVAMDFDTLVHQFPTEAGLVHEMKNAPSEKKILKTISQNTSDVLKKQENWVTHIKNEKYSNIEKMLEQDPIYQQKSAVILDLQNKRKFYKAQLKDIDNELKTTTGKPLSEQDILDLQNRKIQVNDAIEKTEKLEDYENFKTGYDYAQVGVQGFTIIAEALGYDEAANFATMTGHFLALVGGVVMTGLTSNPAGLLVSLSGLQGIIRFFQSGTPTPSTDQMILQQMSQVIENQKVLWENQKQIIGYLNRIEDILNHKVIGNQKQILEKLDKITHHVIYGFSKMEDRQNRKDYNEMILDTKSLYQPYYMEYSSHEGREKQKALFLCQMDASFCKALKGESEHPLRVEEHIMKTANRMEVLESDTSGEGLDFSSLSHEQINHYFDQPPEYRVKIIPSMVRWLNKVVEELSLYLQDKINHDISLGKEMGMYHVSTQPPRVGFQDDKIKQSPPHVVHPFLQDELFSEIVNLAMVIAPSGEESSHLNKNIGRICRQSQNVEDVAQIMRTHIHVAWKAYFNMIAIYISRYNTSRYHERIYYKTTEKMDYGTRGRANKNPLLNARKSLFFIFLELRRALLALDTMARVGYGKLIDTHPELVFLNHLLKNLPGGKIVGNRFGVDSSHQQYDKVMNMHQLQTLSSMFKGDGLSSLSTLSGRKKVSGDWLNKSLWPECRNGEDEVPGTVSLLRAILKMVNQKYQQVKAHQEKEGIVERINWHRHRAGSASFWQEQNKELSQYIMWVMRSPDSLGGLGVEIYNILYDKILPALSKKEQQGFIDQLYHREKKFQEIWCKMERNKTGVFPNKCRALRFKPLCEHVKNNSRTLLQSLKDRLQKEGGNENGQSFVMFKWMASGKLWPVLPLPPEETWKGRTVGFGRPHLRHQAFLKASAFQHIQPQNCLLNVQ